MDSSNLMGWPAESGVWKTDTAGFSRSASKQMANFGASFPCRHSAARGSQTAVFMVSPVVERPCARRLDEEPSALVPSGPQGQN